MLCPARACGVVGAESAAQEAGAGAGPAPGRSPAEGRRARPRAAGGGEAARGGAQAAEPRDCAPRAGAALEPWPPTASPTQGWNFPATPLQVGGGARTDGRDPVSPRAPEPA